MTGSGRLSQAGSRSRHSAKQARVDLGSGPVRTCVGCRERDLADRLVRIVAATTEADPVPVVLDRQRTLPGRGAWLHPTLRCFELAERRRAFARALRLAGPADVRAVREEFEALEGQ